MTTTQEAKDILGPNSVFGPDEWKAFFGDKFQIAHIPEIPWSDEELKHPGIERKHFLFLGVERLGSLYTTLGNWGLLYPTPEHPQFIWDRYQDNDFYRKSCLTRWYMMPIEYWEDQDKLSYDERVSLLPNDYEVPAAIERVTANLLFFLLNKKFMDAGHFVVTCDKGTAGFIARRIEVVAWDSGLAIDETDVVTGGVAASRKLPNAAIEGERFPTRLIEDVESIKNKLRETVVIVNAGEEGISSYRKHKPTVKMGEYSLFERTVKSLYEIGIRNMMVILRDSSIYYDINEVKKLVGIGFKDIKIKIVPAENTFHFPFTSALETAVKDGFKHALCVSGEVLPNFEAYSKALYSVNDRVVVIAKRAGSHGLQAKTEVEGRIAVMSMDYQGGGPYPIAWMLDTSDVSKLRNMQKPSPETLIEGEYSSWNAVSAVYPKEIGSSFNVDQLQGFYELSEYLSKNPLPTGYRGLIDGELLSIVSALNPKGEPDAGDAAKIPGKVPKGILSLLRKMKSRV